MPKIAAVAGVSRAPFLLLPVTLVANGAAAAAVDGSVRLVPTALALIGLLALHIAVNALNEASDYRTGIDLATERTPFSGGSGTLPEGEGTPALAWTVGVLGAAIGLAVGIWFLIDIGWVFAPFVLVGTVAVLAYTDVLLKLGVGEVFAGIGLGLGPVLGTALVQDGQLGATAIAASLPPFFMTFNLLLLNEFPDEAADRAGGRRHLVILLGRPLAAKVYAGAALAVPISIAVAVVIRATPLPCLVAIIPSLLVARPLLWALRRPSQPVPVPALAANVIWNLTTNLTLAAAMALTVLLR
jgi:1,4-dihydroxy-2-naphthoate octaprenyltransferase